MAPTIESFECNDNGVMPSFPKGHVRYCTCHRCYHGMHCRSVIPSECHGTVVLQEDPFRYTKYYVPSPKVEKCECSSNQSGKCCEQKKCLGSNPIPDPVTGKCNCSDPEIRSGEFCEKVNCKNGVTRVTGGKCDCTGYYFHGKFCEKIICHNGGIPNHNNSECLCNNGSSGLHCEYREHNHEESYNWYSTQSTESTFIHKGDDSDNLSGPHVAAIAVPAVVLVVFIFRCVLISRKCMTRKPCAAASSNNRLRASGPYQETSLHTNSAQPNTANTDYLNRPHRPVPSAPIDDQTNHFVNNFSSHRTGESRRNYNVRDNNATPAGPLSNNMDPPPYEEVVNNNTMQVDPSSNDMDPPLYEEAIKMSAAKINVS